MHFFVLVGRKVVLHLASPVFVAAPPPHLGVMQDHGERRTSHRRTRASEPPQRSHGGFVDRFRLSMNVSGGETTQRPIGNPLRRWSPSPIKDPESNRHGVPMAAGSGRAAPSSSPLGPERLSPVLQPDDGGRRASASKKTQPPPRRLTEPVRKVGSPASLARRDLPAASPRQQPRSVAASPPRPVGSSPERRKPQAEPTLKVGIVLMTRKPHRFDFWLRYHRSIGITRVFVHVEDTPELLALLETAEFADFVTVTAGSDRSEDTHKPKSENNYYTLMERQERHVRASVLEARKRDIDWRVRAT